MLDPEGVSNLFALKIMFIKLENSKFTQFADYILDTCITEEALYPLIYKFNEVLNKI